MRGSLTDERPQVRVAPEEAGGELFRPSGRAAVSAFDAWPRNLARDMRHSNAVSSAIAPPLMGP